MILYFQYHLLIKVFLTASLVKLCFSTHNMLSYNLQGILAFHIEKAQFL